MRVVLKGVFAAPMERLAGKLMEVLLVATGEMASAAESHLLQNVANPSEALVVALLGVDQQLPNPIQAEGALQFGGVRWKCSLDLWNSDVRD